MGPIECVCVCVARLLSTAIVVVAWRCAQLAQAYYSSACRLEAV